MIPLRSGRPRKNEKPSRMRLLAVVTSGLAVVAAIATFVGNIEKIEGFARRLLNHKPVTISGNILVGGGAPLPKPLRVVVVWLDILGPHQKGEEIFEQSPEVATVDVRKGLRFELPLSTAPPLSKLADIRGARIGTGYLLAFHDRDGDGVFNPSFDRLVATDTGHLIVYKSGHSTEFGESTSKGPNINKLTNGFSVAAKGRSLGTLRSLDTYHIDLRITPSSQHFFDLFDPALRDNQGNAAHSVPGTSKVTSGEQSSPQVTNSAIVLATPIETRPRITEKETDAWLIIRGVDLFGYSAAAQIKIITTVNDTKFVYPSLEGVEWIEVGPTMAPQQFHLPPRGPHGYEIKFEMVVRPSEYNNQHGGDFKSTEVVFVSSLPITRVYSLHPVEGGIRGPEIKAVVRFTVSSDPNPD